MEQIDEIVLRINNKFLKTGMTTTKPFFSIIIPTKNRPELLRDAIASVILQDFDDYELLVSDNFNDDRTKKTVDEFINDKHLIYIRTEKELNMPDHWEFITQKAKGLYVLVLTDRSFLRRGSLRDIYNSISKTNNKVEVCMWNYGHYDEKNKILFDEKEKDGVEFIKSKDIIEKFSKTMEYTLLPLPHMGCYRFDVAEKIRQNIGRLCWPVCPDGTSAFLLLAHSDSVMHIPRPLFFFQGETVSNANSLKFNSTAYISSLNLKKFCEFVPIKVSITYSVITNDLLIIKNLLKEKLGYINIDWVSYFVGCYIELRGNITRPDADKKFQKELLEEWNRVLHTYDKKFQKEVWMGIRKRYKEIIKSYIRSSFAGNFLANIKRFLLGRPTVKGLSALEAGGFNKL